VLVRRDLLSKLERLDDLALVVAGRQPQHLIDHVPLSSGVQATRTAHPISSLLSSRAGVHCARGCVVVAPEGWCRAASTPWVAA